MKHSHLKLVSIGIVAATKASDTKFVEVYPIEVLPFLEGEITDEIETITRSAEDAGEQKYTVTLNRGMTVKAEWSGETNRKTSPNVVKGEQVRLWTMGNSEKYYWDSMGRDDKFRRQETIVHSWAASKEGLDADIELDDTNTYNLTIDTFDQHITLRTSKDNGEHTDWTCQLHTKDGHLTFKDGEGNVAQIDSKNTKITLLNKDKTFLTLDKKDIIGYAPNDIELKAENDVRFIAGNDMLIDVGNDLTEKIGNNRTATIGKDWSVKVGGSYTLDVTKDYTAKCVNYSMTASAAATIDSPAITFNGKATIAMTSAAISMKAPAISMTGSVAVIGPLALAGPLAMGPGPSGAPVTAAMTGDVTMTGTIAVTGAMSITGALTVGGDVVAPTFNGSTTAQFLIDT